MSDYYYKTSSPLQFFKATNQCVLFDCWIKYIYGKLVRSCWDGLSVVLTTLFVDRLTLSGFKSSFQFTSFHQYFDMLSSERMDVENNS